MIVRHMGQDISLARMIQHYRFMVRANPARASFWRQMVRTIIADYRDQQRQHDERLAA
ncbi:hypothetical protein [Sphingomonas japonica]|uniref:Uncharacterized protein n=1 Tax=Sphingomonas japonica TaxID=511662 RepID=A0ABX0U4S1_9SPHN|nr:hypothetical protein [Sphingomonas japonica]NIJ24799.1 hypothetical protein [Sphingomonas japonica]